MVRRAGDKTAEPPGGRAAERLRMFQEARPRKRPLQQRKKRKHQRTPRRIAHERGGNFR